MQIFGAALGWLLGVCWTHTQPSLLSMQQIMLVGFLTTLALGAVVVCRLKPLFVSGYLFFLPSCLMTFVMLMCGVMHSQYAATQRLADRLADIEINRVTRVTIQIVSLPRINDEGASFEVVQWGESLLGIPQRIAVNWPVSGHPKGVDIMPGQIWRMALRFKPVHGRMNPAGFDQEGLWFARGVRATATVRGEPQFIYLKAWSSLEVFANHTRHHIRKAMRHVLGDRSARAVLIALAIGDQQGVSREDWEIFSLTGITHLVSISGSHVTLIAALGGVVMSIFWRRGRWQGVGLSERLPARLLSIRVAVLTAFFYCLLAGWGVPAQRTFFMVLFAATSYSLAVPLSGFTLMALAAAFLTFFDPWAVLSTGFWLSFMAVGVLIMLSQRVDYRPVGCRQDAEQGTRPRLVMLYRCLATATHLQWLITLAMLPVLAWLFNQVSWVSMFANAVAIPVMTFIVTPLALLLAIAAPLLVSVNHFLIDRCLDVLATLSHAPLALTLWWVKLLAHVPGASFDVASNSIFWLVWALIGVVWAILPPIFYGRHFAWLMILPLFMQPSVSLKEGEWSLYAFDIGQGSALLVRTDSEDLIFDTGWRFREQDAMTSTVWPALRALSLKAKPTVVISHDDLDHVGGLAALKLRMTLGHMYAPIAMPSGKICEAGHSWQANGVRFEFLHPDTDLCRVDATSPSADKSSKKKINAKLKNRCSCVLHIQGKHHSILLTGDIDHTAEKEIIARQLKLKGALSADVVIVPHHGAATSSSDEFVQAIKARHAIAQLGYLNRFGHPDYQVEQRWKAAKTKFWRTDLHGAVHIRSEQGRLIVEATRLTQSRYWHNMGE